MGAAPFAGLQTGSGNRSEGPHPLEVRHARRHLTGPNLAGSTFDRMPFYARGSGSRPRSACQPDR